MRKFIILITCVTASLVVCAKPHCQGFNNYDGKVTIVFTDDASGDRYAISNVKLIPDWKGEEYQAISVKVGVKDGVATVALVFPHLTRFSNPKVTFCVNGRKKSFKVCQ